MFSWSFFQTSASQSDLTIQQEIISPLTRLKIQYSNLSQRPTPDDPESYSDIDDQKKIDQYISQLTSRCPLTQEQKDNACTLLIGKPVRGGKIVPLAQRAGFVELEDDIEKDMVLVEEDADDLTQSFIYIPESNG